MLLRGSYRSTASHSYTHFRVLLLTGWQVRRTMLVHELNRALCNGEIAIGVLGHTPSATGDLWSAVLQRLIPPVARMFPDELDNAAAGAGNGRSSSSTH